MEQKCKTCDKENDDMYDDKIYKDTDGNFVLSLQIMNRKNYYHNTLERYISYCPYCGRKLE